MQGLIAGRAYIGPIIVSSWGHGRDNSYPTQKLIETCSSGHTNLQLCVTASGPVERLANRTFGLFGW